MPVVPRAFPGFSHVYRYRRYIWKNAWNDIRYRYAGTSMGMFWNVLHPLVEILIYTLVFSWIFPARARGRSYRLYLIMGILLWRCFSELIQRGSSSLAEHSRYLKRLNIPPEVFIAKSALSATLILILYVVLFVPISALAGNPIHWKLVFLPVFLVLLQGLAFGITLSSANLQVLFPDTKEFISAVMPLWRWTLPLIYPETVLPEGLRAWLFLNPPYLFIQSIRRLVLEGEFPGVFEGTGMILWLVIAAGIGVIVNQQLRVDVKDTV